MSKIFLFTRCDSVYKLKINVNIEGDSYRKYLPKNITYIYLWLSNIHWNWIITGLKEGQGESKGPHWNDPISFSW